MPHDAHPASSSLPSSATDLPAPLCLTRTHISASRPNAGPHCAVTLGASGGDNDAVESRNDDAGQASWDSEACLAVAAGQDVELFNDRLHLVSCLPFSDAFPSSKSEDTHVRVVAATPKTGRIAAASDSRVALWNSNHATTSASKSDYKVHSTLSTGFPVECLDICGDMLAAGGSALAIYALHDHSGFPTWSRRYLQRFPIPLTIARFSSDRKYLALSFVDYHVAQIYRLDSDNDAQDGSTSSLSGKLTLKCISEPWHNSPLHSIRWLPSGDSPALLTQASDGISRIWRTLPDEPDFWVLWASLGPAQAFGGPVLASYWIRGSILANDALLSVSMEGKIAVTRVQGLHGPATTAAKVVTERLSDINLPKSQLSRLRYSLVLERNTHGLKIYGVSKTGAFSLFDISLPEQDGAGPSVARLSLRLTRHSRYAPTQNIVQIVPSGDARSALSIGQQGELILWRARTVNVGPSQGWRTAGMEAIAAYRPRYSNTVRHVALSQDGAMCAVVGQDVTLFKQRNHRLVALSLDKPSSLFPADVMAIALSTSGVHKLYLVLVDDSAIVRTYLIDTENERPAAELVHTSMPLLTAAAEQQVIANIAPTGINGDTCRIVCSSHSSASLAVASLILDGKATMCKTEYKQEATSASVQPGHVTHLCCSQTNYVAIVTRRNGFDVLTIINTQTSLFASGLEYTISFKSGESICNIAFTASTASSAGASDLANSSLLVTLDTRIVLIAQNRLDYYRENSLWVILASTPLASHVPLSSACPVFGASSFAAAGLHTHLLSPKLHRDTKPSELLEVIEQINAPLPDYHPQLLMQCLLSGKNGLVDRILSMLASAVKSAAEADRPIQYESVSPLDFIQHATQNSTAPGSSDFFLNTLSADSQSLGEDEGQLLYEAASNGDLPGLSLDECQHLRVLIETVRQVEAQRRALDTNGMRFLISLRSFAINQANILTTPQSTRPSSPSPSIRSKRFLAHPLARLRYRDVLWGYHSESQEILLQACSDVCGGPMLWEDARALGLSLWVRSPQDLASQLEIVARNEYTLPEDRDPTLCSLYYFALRKKRLVQGLWRQATFHKERPLMLKFLMNDFDEPRWQSAAMKNAFALMGKQRFHYAAAFFLLGDSLKDCVNVCLRQLNDFHLAIMITRVYEGDDGPIFRNILQAHILPLAFSKGYRRLASWAFWMLKRRDLAVRVIVTPLSELVTDMQNPAVKEVGNPAQEDPSLVLLYGQLRDWSLQTLKGSSAITPLRETQFILHIAQVFRRMGCHILALDLVRNWGFRSARDQIFSLLKQNNAKMALDQPFVNGETPTGRPSFHHRRRSSLMAPKRRGTIILDVPSAVHSRAASPERQSNKKDEEEAAGFRKVVREVKAPPPEFDMSSFGF